MSYVQCAWYDAPQGTDVLLAGLHVHIHEPQVEPLRMRVDDALEKRAAPFWFAELVLELRKLRNCLQVCATA